MNHFVVSAQLVFVCSSVVAFIFLRRATSLCRIYGTYWAVIAFWSLTVGFQHVWLAMMSEELWGWFLHLGCIFIPALFLHFASEWSGEPRIASRIAYLVSFVYLALNSFTTLFTYGTAHRDAYAYPVPFDTYILYFLTFVAMVLVGLLMLIGKLRRLTDVRQKKWLAAFTLLTAGGYLGGMDNFLIMVDLRFYPLYPYGLYLVVPYALLGSYAFARAESGERHAS